MPPPRAALCLSRLLDRREPEDGVQGALPRPAALDGRGMETVCGDEAQRPREHYDIACLSRRLLRFARSDGRSGERDRVVIARSEATKQSPRRSLRTAYYPL